MNDKQKILYLEEKIELLELDIKMILNCLFGKINNKNDFNNILNTAKKLHHDALEELKLKYKNK